VDTNFATTVHLDSVIGQLADNGTAATFDRTTDSLEVLRDRGDAAWITAAGFSIHSAADVLTAFGTGSALTACLTATGFATPTNITAASGVSLAASQHVIVDSGTVTTLTNLPSIPANWITAAGITAAALDGKGNWNIGKTGYSLTQSFPTNFADLAITVTTGRVTVGTNADKTGYSISGTKTTLDALNDITAASVVTALGTGSDLTACLTATGFATTANFNTLNAVLVKLDTTLVADAAVYQFTANALELGPTGGTPPTVDEIAAVILETPANLLATDTSGRVTCKNRTI